MVEETRKTYAPPTRLSQAASPGSSSDYPRRADDPVPGGRLGGHCLSLSTDQGYTDMKIQWAGEKGWLRSNVRVQQDMTVLEILHVRAGLEMFLEGVTALVGGGGEGGLVDGGGHVDSDI